MHSPQSMGIELALRPLLTSRSAVGPRHLRADHCSLCFQCPHVCPVGYRMPLHQNPTISAISVQPQGFPVWWKWNGSATGHMAVM
jgi:ferredoxin